MMGDNGMIKNMKIGRFVVVFGVVILGFRFETERIVNEFNIHTEKCAIVGEECVDYSQRFVMPLYTGMVLVVLTIGLGIYLIFFSRIQKMQKKDQQIVRMLKGKEKKKLKKKKSLKKKGKKKKR